MNSKLNEDVVLLWDEANGVVGDANCSQPVQRPSYISIDGMDGSSTFAVEARLHQNAVWQEIDTVDNTQPSALIVMDNPPAMVRIKRKTGADQVIVYAQR